MNAFLNAAPAMMTCRLCGNFASKVVRFRYVVTTCTKRRIVPHGNLAIRYRLLDVSDSNTCTARDNVSTLSSMNLLKDYPFSIVTFPEILRSQVSQEFLTLESEFQISPSPEVYSSVGVSFVSHCLRPLPDSREDWALACHAMYIILYFNDLRDRDSLIENSKIWLHVLSSMPGESCDSNANCFDGFMEKFHRHRHYSVLHLAHFICASQSSTTAMVMESKICAHNDHSRLALDTYRMMRRGTICVSPFLEVVKMVTGQSMDLQHYFGPLTRELDSLATEIQYVANDLYSIERDRQLGQANLVALIARDYDCEIGRAIDMVIHEHRQLVAKFVQLGEVLMNSVMSVAQDIVSSEDVSRYMAMLEGCIWGNVAAVHELRERYSEQSS